MTTIALFTDDPMRAPAYKPRHRSKRRERGAPEQIGNGGQNAAPYWSAYGPSQQKPAALADLINVSAAPDLLDQLTLGQLRCLLEACAISDYVISVPQIANLIAHRSHTAETLSIAWHAFRKSTRDAYALHRGSRHWRDFFAPADLGPDPARTATEIKFGLADDAWSQIIHGPSRRRAPSDGFRANAAQEA
ncbi:MAG TPA: hypothetical protein VGI66_04105 [Streptosporangiaceae bacterium]|jgi:hypothetical protein